MNLRGIRTSIFAFIAFILMCPCSIQAASNYQLPDSIVTEDNVYKYMFTDFDKAQAIMQAMRERKKLPDWELDYVEGDLLFNTGHYYQAVKLYKQALENQQVKKDNTIYMDLLHRMVSCYDCVHNEALKSKYLRSLLEKAESCNDKTMQAVALFNIGKDQYEQGNKKAGAEHMEEATKMMASTDYKNKYDNLRYNYNSLLIFYIRDHRGDDALRTLDALEKVITASTGKENASIDGLDIKEKKTLYANKAVVYNMLGKNTEADIYYKKYLSLGPATERDNYLVMPYLFARKKYDEVFRICLDREKFLIGQRDTINLHMASILHYLGRAYYKIGQYQQAADYYNRLASLRDSIKVRELRSSAQELAESYENSEKDKLIVKQEEQKIILGMICLVIIIIMIVGSVSYRKIRQRNASLVRAVKKSIDCNNDLTIKEEELRKQRARTSELEQMIEELKISNNAISSLYEEKTNQEAKMAEDLDNILHEIKEKKLFLKPALTPKIVQNTTGAPASLLGDFFEHHTGKKFKDYITGLRMEYAAQLLLEYPNYTIEYIGNMCGIESRQHFHRLFSSHFGITPSAFRNSHIGGGRKLINKISSHCPSLLHKSSAAWGSLK